MGGDSSDGRVDPSEIANLLVLAVAGLIIGWSNYQGTLWTNQVLLNIVIPLWLVEATDAPHVLLAWLFGTNTVLCIFLPAYTSKGVRNLQDAMRYVWISSAFFAGSCLITMVTHSTTGLLERKLVCSRCTSKRTSPMPSSASSRKARTSASRNP